MPILVDFDTVPQLFRRLVAHYEGRQRPMLGYKDRDAEAWVDLTWEEVQEQAEAMAGYFYEQGVRRGDRVAVLSENRPEWVISDLAAQLLGAVHVAIYPSLPEGEVQYILDDAGAKLLVVSSIAQLRKAEAVFDDCPDLGEVLSLNALPDDSSAHARSWDEALAEGVTHWKSREEELRPLAEATGPDDPCALIYTSGTTGKPKGVVLTHRNFCSNTKAALEGIEIRAEDHHLSFLPLCHAFERTAGYLAVLATGARITYAESIHTIERDFEEVSPTLMIAVPRLFEKIYGSVHKKAEEGSAIEKLLFDWAVRVGRQAAEARRSDGPGLLLQAQQGLARWLVFSQLHRRLGGRLRFAFSGGAALPRKVGLFFEAAGLPIVEGYGLTETAPIVAINPPDRPRFGTVGHVLPGTTVGIRHLEEDRVIAQFSGDDYPTGRSSREGEILVKGPSVMKGYWNDEVSTREVIDAEGWCHTGDVGRFTDGYLEVTDRLKHMIVTHGGENVYPGPIEDQFRSVPWIDQLMVVGEGREFLTALVVPDAEALAERIEVNGTEAGDSAALIGSETTRQIFETLFREYSREAGSHKKIRAFRLLDEPFTVENEMMTPTMKLRRRAIEARYGDLIEEMYAKFEV